MTLAESEPEATLPAADALGERLADDEEFYYVRARCAEALGYVAVDAPAAVTDPETLADLRVGLAFDEPEVKEKLAKALAHVALGDPVLPPGCEGSMRSNGRIAKHAPSM